MLSTNELRRQRRQIRRRIHDVLVERRQASQPAAALGGDDAAGHQTAAREAGRSTGAA